MNIKELTIIYKEYITKKNVGWTMAKKKPGISYYLHLHAVVDPGRGFLAYGVGN